MANPSQEIVMTALSRIVEPQSGQSVTDLGLIQGLIVKDGHVHFVLDIGDRPAEARFEDLRLACENAVRAISGVRDVRAILTAHRPPPQAPPARTQSGAQSRAPARPAGPHSKDMRAGPVPGVCHVIAVASGKGGVGKSTVAANLALALQQQGLKVGLMDADIYGPSVPRLLGIADASPDTDNKILQPLEAHGLKAMSIGFLVEEAKAMIWRGPMVMTAVTQLLFDVAWAPLDVLVVDMPPGTGDAQLTMAQRVPLAGAVIVSTPQDIALIDARKGLAMFEQVKVPVFGIVENMSYFLCPHCGERSEIFGHGGARDESEKLNTDFLGEVPLHAEIRFQSDAGLPVVAQDPDGPQAAPFLAIGGKIAAKLKSMTPRTEPGVPLPGAKPVRV